jgi:tetratricopeptide (TPR) repeat protein
MATTAQNRQNPIKYSVHSEAASLFKFLTGTFFQMPKPVQVLGWLVFLVLFVYLVLYPILGITYYEGQVETLSFDQQGNRVPSRTQGASIKKGNKVLTNEDGEFTLGVHWPYIPFTSVEFKVEAPGVPPEDVSIPAPSPFVSLFNPNLRKIYCVPGSKMAGANGLAKRFFLDLKEATEALDKSRPANSAQSSLAIPAKAMPKERLALIPTVYAAGTYATERNYTLRLRDAKVSGIDRAAQVYLDIRIDGQPFGTSSLPDASSSELRDLTVFSGSPVHFESVYLPIPVGARRVDISMIERKSFFQRDPLVGTVTFTVDPKMTGMQTHLAGGNMELTVELLPPAGLKCMTVTGKKGNNLAAMWLNMENQYLGSIAKLQYDLGSNFPSRYIASTDPSSELDSFDYYSYVISIPTPQPVKARVDFTSGSSLNLAAFCDAGSLRGDSGVDYYFLALADYDADAPGAALLAIKEALRLNPEFAPSHNLKGIILTKLKRYDEAVEAFKDAIRLAPNSHVVFSSYAWAIVEYMTSPSQLQLLEARTMAEHAVRLRPFSGNYETLGWAEYRLGELDKALADMLRAEKLCAGSCEESSEWQEIKYHLGKIYVSLRKVQEAKQSFQAVLKYQKSSPETSNDKYVEDAKVTLKTIKARGGSSSS